MKNKFIVFFLIFTSFLFAQYNEKKVLLKKAERLNEQSKFEKANLIYLDLLNKNPDDDKVAGRYINNLLRTSKYEEAGKFLDDHRNIFPEIDFTRYKIMILIRLGKIEEAISTAQKFLKKYPKNITDYREFGNLFQGYKQFEFARKLFLKGRKIAHDENLFSLELADNYRQTGDFSSAVQEIMKHLQNNKAFFHYDLNKLKGILHQDKSQIKTIKQIAENRGDKKLLEVYALCLAEIGDYEQALKKYEYLDVNKLRDFAEENLATGNLKIALKAWEKVLTKTTEPDQKSYAIIQISKIYIYQNKLDEAEKFLLQVYRNKKIQNYGLRYKTKANRLCREMLAEIAVRRHESEEKVLKYLRQAEKFSYNKNEKKEIEFEIIHYLLMNGNFDESRKLLRRNLKNEDPSSAIFKNGYFYSYLIAVMQQDSLADSLLTEIVINIPGSSVANDALFLSNFLKNLPPQARDKFLSAYRKKMLFDDKDALGIMDEIYRKTQNEEILFLSGEWAENSGDSLKAEQVFSHKFSDETLAQYARLKSVRLKKDKKERVQLAGDFLKANPQSVFSPEFREIIFQKEIGEVVE